MLLDARRASVTITPFEPRMSGAVRAFNRRLKASGVPYQFPEASVPAWLPPHPGRRTFQRYYLAVEDGETVRGGYILKWQDFFVGGRTTPVGYVHLPLSEGLIDRKYGALGVQLIMHACKQAPLLFALGIGSMDEPLARMLKALKWPVRTVPFYFRVLRPFTVARGLTYLRKTTPRRIALELAAHSGAAWLALRVLQGNSRPGTDAIEEVERFDSWADEVWLGAREAYRFVGCRDAETLNLLFPGDGRFIRLKVSARGVAIGWVVLRDTPMRGHKYFGDLRVGSIVDCFSRPEDARRVVGAGLRWLEGREVDLVVSNQTANAWCEALRYHGFLSGPSTFIFAASRPLHDELQPFAASFGHTHMTRSDGDGPINL